MVFFTLKKYPITLFCGNLSFYKNYKNVKNGKILVEPMKFTSIRC